MNDESSGGYLGVDGCRAGWVAAWVSQPSAVSELAVLASFDEVLKAYAEAVEIWVDIPVGLSGGGVVRQLDAAMRVALKSRKSSVFPSPCRAALAAESYRQAREIELNNHARSLSAQAYHLIPKIRQVDRFLQAHPAWGGRVFESHPELCFQRLNGDRPLLHPKKDAAGWEERAALLEKWLPGVRATALAFLCETRRSQVQPDDVLDALVLGVAAWLNRGRREAFLRQSEEHDSAGIALRIACPPPLFGEKSP
ncbi:MAG: hypothetical protein KatS3mg045_0783 [Bellilinea sp.]|nr:MAG: hypothetical protein KatS3mg045_0783 [Bellilinea sp.]